MKTTHVLLVLAILSAVLLSVGCDELVKTAVPSITSGDTTVTSNDSTPAVTSSDVTPVKPVVTAPAARTPLYWENTTDGGAHPERKPWTDHIFKLSDDEFISSFQSASDVTKICPKFKTITKLSKQKTIGEFLSALSVHESGHNPAALMRECRKDKCVYKNSAGQYDCRLDAKYGYCMKGGHKLDEYTVVSRGLLQESLESAIGYGCSVATPNDLHDPLKNLECATIILKKQIKKTGLIAGQSNYWAPLKPTNENQKVILARVQRLVPECK